MIEINKIAKSKFIPIGILLIMLLLVGYLCISKYYTAKILCKEIKSGNNIETTFSNGSTAPLFLDNLACVMQIDGPKIPLVEACYYKNVQAVTVLLNNGADPNKFIEGRWSPLEACLVNGPIDEKSYEIVKLLVSHGCNINKHASSESVIVRLSKLIGSGNNSKYLEKIFYYLLDEGVNKTCDGYERIFHYSILSGDVEFITKLIENYGFNVNSTDENGITPLILATKSSSNKEMYEIISLLIQKGADTTLTDKNGNDALFYAKQIGNTQIIDLLVAKTTDGSVS